ncbi:unnamed protein product [Bursaphelenchus okinawaensis]|uniref:Anoctamin n=1 Tax=Bursaphelenchus okinawaensis TaxID=465554 RepID=A0A811K434_9BILA|nr:unnamed protein product [Bursaphelenchus okinawaensis]CAG9090279.1 unnamed protein product [Bursaphelenchus okinawaensis]
MDKPEEEASPKNYCLTAEIDFVLVYEENSEKTKKAERRKDFEENLTRIGLKLQEGPVLQNNSTKYNTVLIHCPFKILCRQAELHHIRKPTLFNDFNKKYRKRECQIFPNLQKLPDEVFNRWRMSDFFYEEFNHKRIEKYIGSSDEANFFTSAERSRITYDLLLRTRHDANNEKNLEFGIERLISENVYHCCFPLHESFHYSDQDEIVDMNDREVLYRYWTKITNFISAQPLDLIKKYFGSKISFYFAWLGFYTRSLMYMAAIGVLFCFAGIFFSVFDVPSDQICNKSYGGKIYLCALHKHVEGNKLQTFYHSCLYAKISYVFDNPCTIIMAVITAVWATTFLESWGRFAWQLKYRWQLLGHEEEDELIRPQYQYKYMKKRQNSVREDFEDTDYMVKKSLFSQIVAISVSWLTALFFMLLIVGALVGMLVYQVILTKLIRPFDPTVGTVIVSISGASINFIFILIMGVVYQKIAYRLTEWECPMTQNQFDNQYAVKVFCFQFVNYYSSIFYIAFFRGKFNGAPPVNDEHDLSGDYWPGIRLFGHRTSECSPAGCMVELIIQLFVTMCGKQFLGLVVEVLSPTVTHWWRERHVKQKGDKMAPRDDVQLIKENFAMNAFYSQHLFQEYVEMVIQFGFCAMFTAAFPLTPLFALLNNLLEVRGDSYKLVRMYRRPVALISNGIGIWAQILNLLSNLSVFINAMVIAFSSDLIPRLFHMIENDFSLETYWNVTLDLMTMDENKFAGDRPVNATNCYFRNDWKKLDKRWYMIMTLRLAFVLILEHLVLGIKRLLAWMIPDVPKKIAAMMKYHKYLKKKELMKSEGVSNVMHLAYQPGKQSADQTSS